MAYIPTNFTDPMSLANYYANGLSASAPTLSTPTTYLPGQFGNTQQIQNDNQIYHGQGFDGAVADQAKKDRENQQRNLAASYYDNSYLSNLFNNYLRAANNSEDNYFRQRQIGLGKILQRQAEGRGPSLANATLNKGIGDAIAQSNAAIISGSGSNGALGLRTAAYNAGNLTAQAAQNAAINRIAEVIQARNQYAELLAQARAAAAANAQMAQQRAIAQAQLAVQNNPESFPNYLQDRAVGQKKGGMLGTIGNALGSIGQAAAGAAKLYHGGV